MTVITASDGVRLHAESTGCGEPVLFIHEYAGDHRSWARQVAALSREFRCITYAARGYPPSDVPPDQHRYSYTRQADDAIDVMDGLNVREAHVVGLSMGGYCALQLGMGYPERVRSLFLASTGTGGTASSRGEFLIEIEELARAFRANGSRTVAEVMALKANRTQLRDKNRAAWGEFVAQLAEHSAEGMALTALGVHMGRPPLYELTRELQSIHAPTLIVCGEEDDDCVASAIMLNRTISSSRLYLVPHSGHTLNLEDPDHYNDELRSFIKSVEQASAESR